VARAISRQDRADFHARPAQAPAPSSKKAVSFSSTRNNEALIVAMRVNCEVRVLARQPNVRINSLCNPARFKKRGVSEQKSGACDVRCRRSWFEPDFFKQGGESRISTQLVQAGANGELAENQDSSIFEFRASPKTSKGFIVIA
jgi:hypothetical protein